MSEHGVLVTKTSNGTISFVPNLTAIEAKALATKMLAWNELVPGYHRSSGPYCGEWVPGRSGTDRGRRVYYRNKQSSEPGTVTNAWFVFNNTVTEFGGNKYADVLRPELIPPYMRGHEGLRQIAQLLRGPLPYLVRWKTKDDEYTTISSDGSESVLDAYGLVRYYYYPNIFDYNSDKIDRSLIIGDRHSDYLIFQFDISIDELRNLFFTDAESPSAMADRIDAFLDGLGDPHAA